MKAANALNVVHLTFQCYSTKRLAAGLDDHRCRTRDLQPLHVYWRITVAARPKARTVFARSNAGIVGSKPTQCKDVCIVCVYSVFMLFSV
jgi:hypothetical protein